MVVWSVIDEIDFHPVVFSGNGEGSRTVKGTDTCLISTRQGKRTNRLLSFYSIVVKISDVMRER